MHMKKAKMMQVGIHYAGNVNRGGFYVGDIEVRRFEN